MPVPISLDTAFEEILDAAVNLLRAEARPGKQLAGVSSIVRGDSVETPNLPAVWVYAEPAQNNQRHAHSEIWTLPLVVVATVESNEPGAGYRRATQVASGARRVLIRVPGRRLGLDSYVQDTQSARFEASAPWSRRGNLYDALAVVNVMFTVFEPPND